MVNRGTELGLHIFSGVVSAVFGLVVLFNVWRASLVLLGLLLGLHTLVDGISMLIWGRVHVHPVDAGAEPQRMVG